MNSQQKQSEKKSQSNNSSSLSSSSSEVSSSNSSSNKNKQNEQQYQHQQQYEHQNQQQHQNQNEQQIQPQTERTPFKSKFQNPSKKNIYINQNSINNIDTPKKSYNNNKYQQVSISTRVLPNSGKIINSLNIISKQQIGGLQNQIIDETKNNMINNNNNNHQISYTIDYNGQFQNIKKIFIENIKKKNMKIMRQTNNILIAKNQHTYSYKCILSICLPFNDDNTVYQLKNYPTRRSKSKIILIAGNIQNFQMFRKDFCSQLWQTKLIQVNQSNAVQLFFHINRLNFDFISQQCKSILIKRKKQNFNYGKNVLKVLKDSQSNLKRRMQKFQAINSNPSTQKKLEEYIFSSVKISEVFEKIFEEQVKILQQKKAEIYGSHNLHQIFDLLQVQPKLRLTDQQYPLSLSLTPDRTKLPYYSAIQVLQMIKSSNCPSVNIQLASVFNYRLRNACNQCRNMIKMVQLDMDSILPLTIYCVTVCQNSQLLPVTKLMLQYMQQQDNCEAEKKVFTGIQASLEFIKKQWKDFVNRSSLNNQHAGVVIVK